MHKSALTLTLIVSLHAAFADARNFNGVGGSYQHQCEHGETIELSGTDQTMELSGPCDTLQVKGVGNTIRVRMVETLSLEGTDNVVRYGSAASGSTPKIDNQGIDNRAIADADLLSVEAQAAAAPSVINDDTQAAAMLAGASECSPTRTFQGASNEQAIECQAGERILISGVDIAAQVVGNCAAVCVDGSGNRVQVSGDALAIAVGGSDNHISAVRVDAVTMEGIDNRVSYQRTAGRAGPKKDQIAVRKDGIDNQVARAPSGR